MSRKGFRLQVYIISALLLAVGLGLTLYKVFALGFPLFPGESREVWTLESKVTFAPSGGPVDVHLTLPQTAGGWDVLDEYFASSGFGFSVEDGQERRARWTRRELTEPATLYYKAQVSRKVLEPLDDSPVRLPRPRMMEPDVRVAMERLVEFVDQQSSNAESFASLLARELNRNEPMQDAAYLLGGRDADVLRLMEDVLTMAGIPSQRIRGVFLEDGRRRQTMTELVEVHNGDRWVVVDPRNGAIGLPTDFFVWLRGNAPMLDVVGGRNSRLEFAIVRNTLPVKTVLMMEHSSGDMPLIDFSIYSLPVEHQSVFKTLLLIPVGALVVVLLRIFVGVKTSGTFMPILIALAFIQTTLVAGLVIFVAVVSAGLWIRSYLSHLNLLLVARISAVIILVVFLMAAISVASYKLGIDQALSVTLFPTIILSWTIERMSILWEEEGPREVVTQGGGSLAVAVVAYLLMTNFLIKHWTFNFPELIIALLGCIILIGQYRGYRLSELYRFRHLKDL